jgi:hypothetical protein
VGARSRRQATGYDCPEMARNRISQQAGLVGTLTDFRHEGCDLRSHAHRKSHFSCHE